MSSNFLLLKKTCLSLFLILTAELCYGQIEDSSTDSKEEIIHLNSRESSQIRLDELDVLLRQREMEIASSILEYEKHQVKSKKLEDKIIKSTAFLKGQNTLISEKSQIIERQKK